MRSSVRRSSTARKLFPALTLLLALSSIGGVRAAELCWPEGALAYQQGEEKIRRTAGPVVVPPRDTGARLQSAAASLPVGAIRRVELPPKSRKLIALTFDLCEQPREIAGYQGGIVDFLRAQGVKATFFAGGKWLMTHPQRAQQLMSDPLFEIGNHSWDHRNLRMANGEELTRSIGAPQAAYRQLRDDLETRQCRRPGDSVAAHRHAAGEIALFRFPYGACDAKSLEAVAARGLTPIQWDVAAGDPSQSATAPLMIAEVVSRVRPGSIVIFHANGRGWHTPEALPEIVARLKQRGYEFATVGELLKAGRPVIEPRCYNARPGDTDRYDVALKRRAPQPERVQKQRPGVTPPPAAWDTIMEAQ